MANVHFFKNFSINLHRFFKANGLVHVSKGVHKGTGKTFWVYEKTPELIELLKIWSEGKPKK